MGAAGRAIGVSASSAAAQIGVDRTDLPTAPASTSLGPVTGKAATGVPQASASRITSPNVSVRLGTRTRPPPA